MLPIYFFSSFKSVYLMFYRYWQSLFITIISNASLIIWMTFYFCYFNSNLFALSVLDIKMGIVFLISGHFCISSGICSQNQFWCCNRKFLNYFSFIGFRMCHILPWNIESDFFMILLNVFYMPFDSSRWVEKEYVSN